MQSSYACSNIDGVFTSFSLSHDPADSGVCLSILPSTVQKLWFSTMEIWNSIPTAHSVHLHESQENMNLLLHATVYERCSWKICGNLIKAIGVLMEMQSGVTKYCCFLCLWHHRATDEHYVESNRLLRT